MTTKEDNREMKWTLADEIAAGLDKSKRAYDMMVAEFQKGLGVNPIQAISRWSEDMVERQTAYKFWAAASRLVTGDGAAEAVRTHFAVTEDGIHRYFDTISTRQFHNAIDRARAEARLSLARHTIPWLRRLLEIAPPAARHNPEN